MAGLVALFGGVLSTASKVADFLAPDLASYVPLCFWPVRFGDVFYLPSGQCNRSIGPFATGPRPPQPMRRGVKVSQLSTVRPCLVAFRKTASAYRQGFPAPARFCLVPTPAARTRNHAETCSSRARSRTPPLKTPTTTTTGFCSSARMKERNEQLDLRVTLYSGQIGDTFSPSRGPVMPWKECHVEDERMRFVIRLKDAEKMVGLCKDSRVRSPASFTDRDKMPGRRSRDRNGSPSSCSSAKVLPMSPE